MKMWIAGTLLAVMTLGSIGCVAQREVDELRTLYRRSQEQVLELRAQLEEAQARIAALQSQTTIDPQLQAQLDAAIAERDRLREALANAEAQLRSAKVGPELPPELDAALRELAQANPDIMSYDPELGMVKFRSDFTFDLGSANVKAQAQQTLNRLAGVLRSPAAAPYEVRIVGHTDNVRIANPATKAKHPTNWHLSAHRAISVEEVLEKAGVQPARMSVAGYGPYRPVVANGPRGAEANRRVEIYLVAMTTASAAPAATPAAESSAPAASEAPAVTPGQPRQVEDAPVMYK